MPTKIDQPCANYYLILMMLLCVVWVY